MAFTTLQAHIEFPVCRRVLYRRGIIPIHWIIFVGINATEEFPWVSGIEILKKVLHLVFTGIGCCCQKELSLDLAAEIECQAARVPHTVELTRPYLLDAAVSRSLADGEICKGDVEPVVCRYVDIPAEVKSARLRATVNGNVDHMLARWQNALGNKSSLWVEWNEFVESDDAVSLGNILAIDRYRTAIDWNVAEGGPVFRIARRHAISGIG